MKKRVDRGTVIILCLGLAGLAGAGGRALAACSNEDVMSTRPAVITIAGDGYPGIVNGPQSTASFIQPDGVAVDKTGKVFVADRSAQNIRLISHGRVSIYAGSSDVATRQRAGGYIDGPAHLARFDMPRAVAVGPDGTLYVADFRNHAVRRVRNGVVSTLIGPDRQPADRKNLIRDAGFTSRNSPSSGWTVEASDKPGDLHFADSRGPARSNALVASITSNASASSAPIQILPGATYALSVFLDSRGNTSNGNVAFYLTDIDQREVFQGYATERGSNGRVAFAPWTAPAGIKAIRVVFRLNGTGITGDVVFAKPELLLLSRRRTVTNPVALAVDAAGKVYVSDVGSGLRVISADGTVAAAPFGASDPEICGVAVRGSGKGLLLAYTDANSVHLIAGSNDKQLIFDDSSKSEPQATGRTVGFACGIAIFDAYTIAVTDYRTNAIRLIRFPIEAPVASGTMVLTLAGGVNEGDPEIGGFLDGPSGISKINTPRGIAIAPDNTLVFADSGNRRIRAILHVDPRGPLPPSLEGMRGPSDRYRVVVFGSSASFHDVLWTDSIPGQIESALAAGSARGGARKYPYVVDIRFSGIDIDTGVAAITNYLGDGEADLVIYVIDFGQFWHEFENYPKLSSPKIWSAHVSSELKRLSATLRQSNTQLLLVSLPDGPAVSDTEGVALHDLSAVGESYDFAPRFKLAAEEEDAIAASGAQTVRLLRTLESAENCPAHVAFYQDGLNYHPSTQAQIFVGREIVRRLETWRPWLKP